MSGFSGLMCWLVGINGMFSNELKCVRWFSNVVSLFRCFILIWECISSELVDFDEVNFYREIMQVLMPSFCSRPFYSWCDVILIVSSTKMDIFRVLCLTKKFTIRSHFTSLSTSPLPPYRWLYKRSFQEQPCKGHRRGTTRRIKKSDLNFF